jgi:hypothetical protein
MRPSSSNSCQALATDDWLGMVSMRIQRPSTRNVLTVLNDCEPPLTCITASVLPCVGRTLPSSSGNQSIWFLNTPVTVPCRSGLTQTWPSDHCDHSRSRCTSGWSCHAVQHGQRMRIEHAGLAPQVTQQPLGFQRQLAAERLRPQRAVEQEDAWWPQICGGKLAVIGLGQCVHQVGRALVIGLFIRLF